MRYLIHACLFKLRNMSAMGDSLHGGDTTVKQVTSKHPLKHEAKVTLHRPSHKPVCIPGLHRARWQEEEEGT